MLFAKEWSFIHIPRTGGVNFRHHALKNPDVQECNFAPEGIEHRVWIHNPPVYWYEHVPHLSSNWITLVRNPYERYLSLYFHLKKTSGKSEFKAQGKWKTTDEQTFEDFVHADKLCRIWDYRNVFNNPWALYDRQGIAWRPYWNQIDWCQGYDVQHFRLEDQLDKLALVTGVDMKSTQQNATQHGPWKDYYSKDLREVVYSRYERDFCAFGYSK